jgi:hypothetical protein
MSDVIKVLINSTNLPYLSDSNISVGAARMWAGLMADEEVKVYEVDNLHLGDNVAISGPLKELTVSNPGSRYMAVSSVLSDIEVAQSSMPPKYTPVDSRHSMKELRDMFYEMKVNGATPYLKDISWKRLYVPNHLSTMGSKTRAVYTESRKRALKDATNLGTANAVADHAVVIRSNKAYHLLSGLFILELAWMNGVKSPYVVVYDYDAFKASAKDTEVAKAKKKKLKTAGLPSSRIVENPFPTSNAIENNPGPGVAPAPMSGSPGSTVSASVDNTFKVPASVSREAQKGLELRKKYNRGGLDTKQAGQQGIGSGVKRAADLVSGTVSLKTVKRMKAFFSRHKKNFRPKVKMPDGGPTAGTIAWYLWGGTDGALWAETILSQHSKKGHKEVSMPIMFTTSGGKASPNSGMRQDFTNATQTFIRNGLYSSAMKETEYEGRAVRYHKTSTGIVAIFYRKSNPKEPVAYIKVRGNSKERVFWVKAVYRLPDSDIAGIEMYMFLHSRLKLNILSDQELTPGSLSVWKALSHSKLVDIIHSESYLKHVMVKEGAKPADIEGSMSKYDYIFLLRHKNFDPKKYFKMAESDKQTVQEEAMPLVFKSDRNEKMDSLKKYADVVREWNKSTGYIEIKHGYKVRTARKGGSLLFVFYSQTEVPVGYVFLEKGLGQASKDHMISPEASKLFAVISVYRIKSSAITGYDMYRFIHRKAGIDIASSFEVSKGAYKTWGLLAKKYGVTVLSIDDKGILRARYGVKSLPKNENNPYSMYVLSMKAIKYNVGNVVVKDWAESASSSKKEAPRDMVAKAAKFNNWSPISLTSALRSNVRPKGVSAIEFSRTLNHAPAEEVDPKYIDRKDFADAIDLSAMEPEHYSILKTFSEGRATPYCLLLENADGTKELIDGNTRAAVLLAAGGKPMAKVIKAGNSGMARQMSYKDMARKLVDEAEDKILQFCKSNTDGRVTHNRWFEFKGLRAEDAMKIYVRVRPRYIRDESKDNSYWSVRSLDIANISIMSEYQKLGIFSSLLKRLENKAESVGIGVIYIENVTNPNLEASLRKNRKYVHDAMPGEFSPSFMYLL